MYQTNGSIGNQLVIFNSSYSYDQYGNKYITKACMFASDIIDLYNGELFYNLVKLLFSESSF